MEPGHTRTPLPQQLCECPADTHHDHQASSCSLNRTVAHEHNEDKIIIQYAPYPQVLGYESFALVSLGLDLALCIGRDLGRAMARGVRQVRAGKHAADARKAVKMVPNSFYFEGSSVEEWLQEIDDTPSLRGSKDASDSSYSERSRSPNRTAIDDGFQTLEEVGSEDGYHSRPRSPENRMLEDNGYLEGSDLLDLAKATQALEEKLEYDEIYGSRGRRELERLRHGLQRRPAKLSLRTYGIDGAEDSDNEDQGDDGGLAFYSCRQQSDNSVEAPITGRSGTLTPPARSSVEAIWPGSVSPRYRHFRSLPSSVASSTADMLRLDGAGNSRLLHPKSMTQSPTHLESSQSGGINEEWMVTAEALIDIHPLPRSRHGSKSRKRLPEVQGSWRGWSTPASGLVTPHPIEESPEESGTTSPKTFFTQVPSMKERSTSPSTSLSSFRNSGSTSIEGCSFRDYASFEPSFYTASPAEPPQLEHEVSGDTHVLTSNVINLTASLTSAEEETPRITHLQSVQFESPCSLLDSNYSASPSGSEPELELHVPVPVVEVTIEDRPGPSTSSTATVIPETETLTAEVQLELDALLKQLIDAICGLVRLGATQDHPSGLLLVLSAAVFRFWQWLLNKIAEKVRDTLADGVAEQNTKKGEGKADDMD